ncbi:hypothetical protein [Staphylococcus capitis]|nr:hypothetical protein [Staphylococcus capitis]
MSEKKRVWNELKAIGCWRKVLVMRSVAGSVLIKKLANVVLV